MWISILHFYFVHLWLLERLIIFSYAYGFFLFHVLWIAYSPFCLFSHFFVHICAFFFWKSFSICYATSLWIMYIENIFVKFVVDIFNLLKCLLTYTCVYESRSVLSSSLQPHGLYSPWNSPSQNTGVGSLSHIQQIFLTQELNWGVLHCRQILYQLSYMGNLKKRNLS